MPTIQRPRIRRGMTLGGVVGTALLALTLAACAAEPGSEPAPDPGDSESAQPGSLRPLMPATHPDVSQYCPDEDAVHLAELGYENPVTQLGAVYTCEVVLAEPEEGDGAGGEQIAYRLVEPGELLLEYSDENDARTDGACALMLADPLIVWVEDGEDLVPIYAPVDECGFPQEDAAAAFEGAERERLVVASEGDTSS